MKQYVFFIVTVVLGLIVSCNKVMYENPIISLSLKTNKTTIYADGDTLVFEAQVNAEIARSRKIEVIFEISSSDGGNFYQNKSIVNSNGIAKNVLTVGNKGGVYIISAKISNSEEYSKSYELTLVNYDFITLNNISTFEADGRIISFVARLDPLLAKQGNQIIKFETSSNNSGVFIPSNGEVVADATSGIATIDFKVGYLPSTYMITASNSSFRTTMPLILMPITSLNSLLVTLSDFNGNNITYADGVSKIGVNINAPQYAGQTMNLELVNGDGILSNTTISLNSSGLGIGFITVKRIAGNFQVKVIHPQSNNYAFSNNYQVVVAYPTNAIYHTPMQIQKNNMQSNTILNAINIKFNRLSSIGKISENIPVILEASLSNNTTQSIGYFTPSIVYIDGNQEINFDYIVPTMDLDPLQDLNIITKIDSVGQFIIDTFKIDIIN